MRWVSCETVTHSQGKLSAQASRRSDAQLAPARVFAHDRRGRVRDLRKLRALQRTAWGTQPAAAAILACARVSKGLRCAERADAGRHLRFRRPQPSSTRMGETTRWVVFFL